MPTSEEHAGFMISPTEKPNILYICVDGQRWDTLSHAGRFRGVTPNLDRLAAEGTTFNHAYCTTPLCHPARASFLTGLYPHRHGIMGNLRMTADSPQHWPDDQIPFYLGLRQAGYHTGVIGAWHWGQVAPSSFGVEVYERPQGAWRQRKNTFDATGVPKILDSLPVYGRWHVPEETTETSFFADRAIAFLDEARNKSPFMLHIDISGPHVPYLVPEPYASRFPPNTLSLAPNATASAEPFRVTRWREYFDLTDWHTEDWLIALSFYLAFVNQVDAAVGRILAHLAKLGLEQNTLVIFTSDHGEMACSRRLIDQGPGGYDELLRVPLLVRWPGRVQAGTISEEFVQTLDICPTVLEAAGYEPDTGLDGISLFETLAGKRLRTSIYCQYYISHWGVLPLRIVRTKAAKLVYSTGDPGELYDLTVDPQEISNVIDDPHKAEVKKQLAAEMLSWMEHTGDPLYKGAKRICSKW